MTTHSIPASVRVSHGTRTSRTAPTSGKALHSVPAPVDSDPHADELLHRVRNPRGNLTACPECHGLAHPGPCPQRTLDAAQVRVEVEIAYILRDREGMDEYHTWVAGVAA